MLQFHFYGLLTLQWERASLLHVLNDHTQRTEVFSSVQQVDRANSSLSAQTSKRGELLACAIKL